MIWTQQEQEPPDPPGLAEALAAAGPGATSFRYDRDHIRDRLHLLGWVAWWWPRLDGTWRGLAADIVPLSARTEEDQARALWAWVRANIRYAREPGEVIGLPGFTWTHRLEDCDGLTLLYLTLCCALGIDGTPMDAWAKRADGVRVPVHVWPLLRLDGRLVPADVTMPIDFGVDPRPLLERLGAEAA